MLDSRLTTEYIDPSPTPTNGMNRADMKDIVALIAPQITKPFGERIMSVSCNFRPNTIDVSYENLPEELLEACRQMVLLKEVAVPVKPVKDEESKKGFALL